MTLGTDIRPCRPANTVKILNFYCQFPTFHLCLLFLVNFKTKSKIPLYVMFTMTGNLPFKMKTKTKKIARCTKGANGFYFCTSYVKLLNC